MARNDCPFCTRIKNAATLMLDRPLVMALPENHPHAVGHAVILPRRHVSRLSELADDEHHELFATAREFLRELDRSRRPDASTLGINDGPAAGQPVGPTRAPARRSPTYR
ncbi:hypothetical protein BH23ACT6_BH23ACT6_24470 [soil metagenome]